MLVVVMKSTFTGELLFLPEKNALNGLLVLNGAEPHNEVRQDSVKEKSN